MCTKIYVYIYCQNYPLFYCDHICLLSFLSVAVWSVGFCNLHLFVDIALCSLPIFYSLCLYLKFYANISILTVCVAYSLYSWCWRSLHTKYRYRYIRSSGDSNGQSAWPLPGVSVIYLLSLALWWVQYLASGTPLPLFWSGAHMKSVSRNVMRHIANISWVKKKWLSSENRLYLKKWYERTW